MSNSRAGCLRLGTATLLMLALTLLSTGHAQAAIYTYQGNNYTSVGPPGGPYTTAMSVSGSFELPLPLVPNSPYSSAAGALVRFSFSDGLESRTEADSVVCIFDLATGPSGEIVRWEIFLREKGVSVGDPQNGVRFDRGLFSARDEVGHGQAAADPCDYSGVFLDWGTVVNDPGIWTSSVAPGLCGDGNVDPGEDCDDGNTTSGDGCSSICMNEVPTLGQWGAIILALVLLVLGGLGAQVSSRQQSL